MSRKSNTIYIGKNKSFWDRNRRSGGYLLKRTAGQMAWSIIRGLLIFGLCFMIIQPLLTRFSMGLMEEKDLYDSTIILLPRNVTLDNYRIVAELTDLKNLVEKYPQSSVSELAGLYVKGLKEGRLLQGGKFEMGSIWERRRGLFDETDSLANDSTFSLEKNTDFVFVIAYERNSVDVNQLLYEMARYNFTAFTVRNFDISEEKGDGIDMMQVRTFLNYDEAYIYMHRLFNNDDMAYKLEGLKCFIISEENLKKLMKGLSFADYFDFYDENFDRIGSLRINEDEPSTLDEPTELPEPPEEDEEEDEEWEEDNYIF